MKKIILICFSAFLLISLAYATVAPLITGYIPMVAIGGSPATLGNSPIFCSGSNCGIGTSSPAGILDVTSTTSAFLPPRMTTMQKNAISPVVDGMVVYDTTLHKLCVYSTGTSTWQTITSS